MIEELSAIGDQLSEAISSHFSRLQIGGNCHKKAQRGTKIEAKRAAGIECGSADLLVRIVPRGFFHEAQLSALSVQAAVGYGGALFPTKNPLWRLTIRDNRKTSGTDSQLLTADSIPCPSTGTRSP